MMNADDEPQSKTNLANNSLISEAFNLNTSLSGFQPMTVLPPTSNHFRPIHSRTPSSELKETLNTSKSSSSSPLKQSSPSLASQSILANNPSSYFDQKQTIKADNSNLLDSFKVASLPKEININQTQRTDIKPVLSSVLEKPVQVTSPPQIFTPIPTKPAHPILTTTNVVPHLASSASLDTNIQTMTAAGGTATTIGSTLVGATSNNVIQPPIPLPPLAQTSPIQTQHHVLPPPTGVSAPPPSLNSLAGSNPYSGIL
jgi:hypothetical protein